jgi:hypothetical protein
VSREGQRRKWKWPSCVWVCLCKVDSVADKGALLQSLLLVPDLVCVQQVMLMGDLLWIGWSA